MHKQRLIIQFDGTWNDPADQTNVYRLSRHLHDYDGDIKQKFFYDPGVGTDWWNKYRGGLFGFGLTKNLLQGYEWLAKRYNEGDEIWIFGFSRGAYTARSLVGLVRKCGLLHITTPSLLNQAEQLYRDKSLHPDSEECQTFREDYSREVKIHFIGVWDTVKALGVPGLAISKGSRYAWHDNELTGIVERAYHAMALDEHRKAYDTLLWTTPDGNKKATHTEVEQRWFIGAHANVGGGYGKSDSLSTIPLSWLLKQAQNAGLKTDTFNAADNAWQQAPKDSFKEFVAGVYAWFKGLISKGDGRFYRHYDQGYKGCKAVNVTVDKTVWQRWKSTDYNYRPKTLVNADIEPPKVEE